VTILRSLAVLMVGVLAILAPGERAARSDRLGVIAGYEATTGRRLFRTQTKGPAAMAIAVVAGGVVVAERRGCGSADLPEPEGSTVLVGYDARSGRERWHQRAGLFADPVKHLTPGVLLVRDARTAERLGLDPRTGQIRWTRGPEPDLVRASTPELLVLTGGGRDGSRLTAVDRTTGSTRWSYEVDGGRTVRFVAADGSAVVAIVGDPPAATFEQAASVVVAAHVLDADTGALQRQVALPLTTLEKAAMRSVVVFGSSVVLDVGAVVGFDLDTGAERWRAAGGISNAQLGGRGDLLLVRAGAGTGAPVSLRAVNPHDGHQRWVYDRGRFDLGGAAITGGVVVFERDGYTALDRRTGRTRWHLGTQRGLEGVSGMTGPDLYLVGGCPVTRAD
jgi:outer membrane protein assembly factor BamB